MPRIVIYCRVAAPDPARPPDAHEPELRALVGQCTQHTLTGAFHDIACSGLSAPLARPGLGALLASLRENPADILLVPALHHLTRDIRVLPALRATLARHGLAIRTAEDLGDGASSPPGQLLFTHLQPQGA